MPAPAAGAPVSDPVPNPLSGAVQSNLDPDDLQGNDDDEDAGADEEDGSNEDEPDEGGSDDDSGDSASDDNDEGSDDASDDEGESDDDVVQYADALLSHPDAFRLQIALGKIAAERQRCCTSLRAPSRMAAMTSS